MTGTTADAHDPGAILACTISRDVQNFDLLIEDMEDAMGESWGDLGFEDAAAFFTQPDAQSLEFVALAVDEVDEEDLAQVLSVLKAAKDHGIKVILIAEDVSPAGLHQLLRSGADEFVPYPLPEGELDQAIARLQRPAPAAENVAPLVAPAEAAPVPEPVLDTGKEGDLIAVQGLAGGVGATTFAVNLAWELATGAKKDNPKVCLIDLGLQTGTIATYLDLPRRDAVYELLSDIAEMDQSGFSQTLLSFDDKMHVLTAPADMLPLDLLAPEDVAALIDMARSSFDYVIVDMPSTIVQWTETVLEKSDIYFALLELDMRSAQNSLRLKRALQAEELPVEKLRYLLNRAPKFTDLQGKSRVKRLAESLDISIDVLLPDGGRAVAQACDHGEPLAEQIAKNPLRKEIAKLAASLRAHGEDAAKAA